MQKILSINFCDKCWEKSNFLQFIIDDLVKIEFGKQRKRKFWNKPVKMKLHRVLLLLLTLLIIGDCAVIQEDLASTVKLLQEQVAALLDHRQEDYNALEDSLKRTMEKNTELIVLRNEIKQLRWVIILLYFFLFWVYNELLHFLKRKISRALISNSCWIINEVLRLTWAIVALRLFCFIWDSRNEIQLRFEL